jgi:type II secretory pathway predicted ATPase ExeA
MELTRFGLRSRPFRASPDVEGYYPSSSHETAGARLTRALADDEGLILLTAEPGMGKTLLAQRLQEQLPANVRSAFLTHGSYRSRAELMQAILFDLKLPYQEMGEQELRLSLMESCLEQFEQARRTILFVDEAHSLSADLLDELRILSNLVGGSGRAAQVMFFALPRIASVIESSALDLFRHRLWTTCRLEPWSEDESVDYLMHQARRCGARPEKLFGEDVLEILTRAANGNPRLLNQCAHLAMTFADDNQSDCVDAEAAFEAVAQLGLDDENKDEMEQERPGVDLSELAETTRSHPVALPLPRTENPPVYVYGGGPETGLKAARPWNAAG